LVGLKFNIAPILKQRKGKEMSNLVAVHSMLVELHGGMLTLAAVCIVATIVSRTHFRMRKTSDNYGIFWPADSLIGKLALYAEPTAYVAAIGGIVGLIASAVVGFYVYPIEFITGNSLGMGKVAFSIFATVLMIVFVFLRSRYGQNLWRNKGTAAVYACVGLVGFLTMVLAGSLGGHMAGKGSVLDPVYAFVGIDPNNFGISLSNMPIVTIGVSLIGIIVPMGSFMYFQRKNKTDSNT